MPVKKMHICFVTNEFPALTETFVTSKALELARRGHRVTVIKNQQNKALNESHVQLVRQAGIEVLSFNTDNFSALAKTVLLNPKLLFSLRLPKQTLKTALQNALLTRHRFDIIHFEFSALGLLYMPALIDLPGKIVVSCRGTAEKVKPLTVKGRGEQLTQLFEKADAVHCVSEDMAVTILPYCKNAKKIFVNRPAIDAAYFVRQQPYKVLQPFQILSVGRFTFQKGYLLGLLAVKQLQQKGIPFKWTIIGDGLQEEEIRFHIHALQLSAVVELAGKKNRNQVLEYYQNASAFLLPSVYEGIANVCLEAMSMEIPVVATKSGGMEEVIVTGENGFLCDVYDCTALADALETLANDPKLAKNMGVRARADIMNGYTIEEQTNLFEENYEKLLRS